LLELAGAEDEVSGGDLVAERLADLADAERWLLAARGEHVREVHENALGGFRAQVVESGLVIDDAEVGLNEAGEGLRLGPLSARATVRARDVCHPVLGSTALLRLECLDEVVLAM